MSRRVAHHVMSRVASSLYCGGSALALQRISRCFGVLKALLGGWHRTATASSRFTHKDSNQDDNQSEKLEYMTLTFEQFYLGDQ